MNNESVAFAEGFAFARLLLEKEAQKYQRREQNETSLTMWAVFANAADFLASKAADIVEQAKAKAQGETEVPEPAAAPQPAPEPEPQPEPELARAGALRPVIDSEEFFARHDE